MKTALYLITGMLGSGKTSTLCNLLSHHTGRGSVLAVTNEVAGLGLDGVILERYGFPVYEMGGRGGSKFLEFDFMSLLQRILDNMPPEKIIVETNGLDDLSSLHSVARRVSGRIGMCKVAALVDAEAWRGREKCRLLHQQLSMADMLLISKLDKFSLDQANGIVEEIKEKYPRTPVHPASHGVIDPEVFFAAPQTKKPVSSSRSTLFNEEYTVFLFESSMQLDHVKFNDFLTTHGKLFLRIKGQAHLDTGLAYLDYVRGCISWHPPVCDFMNNNMVFIGKGHDKAEMEQRLQFVWRHSPLTFLSCRP